MGNKIKLYEIIIKNLIIENNNLKGNKIVNIDKKEIKYPTLLEVQNILELLISLNIYMNDKRIADLFDLDLNTLKNQIKLLELLEKRLD